MSLQKSLFKKIYKAHVYAGLFIAVHFAIFAISGLVLLFKDELQGKVHISENNTQYNSAEGYSAYEKALVTTQAKYSADLPLAMFPDEKNKNFLNFRLGYNGETQLRGARRVLVDFNSGEEIIEKPAAGSSVFDWMLNLHRDLFLGSNGKIYLGFVGLIYVFMLLSGIFIYGKFMKNRATGEIRTQKTLGVTDVHKFFGMISFGWGVIVGLSGTFLAFNGLLIKLFQFQSLKHLTAQYQNFKSSGDVTAPFAKVIASAYEARPESFISYISFPNTEFGIPGHYLMLLNGTTPMTERLTELVVINSQTGLLAEVIQLPLYLKVVLYSEPLHFGDYGGISLKIIWALFTLISLAVVCLGVTSFFMKRRKQTSKPLIDKNHLGYVNAHPYRTPTVLILISIVSIVSALFFEGLVAKIAVAALVIPLAYLVFGWRRDA